MKYSPKVLKQLGKKPTPPKPAVAAVPARWWPLPRWVVLSLCLLLAFGATWAFFEFVVWNTLPAGLVGNWEVVDGPREYSEATFEFFRNGAMEGRLDQDGNLVLINARVKVKGDKNLFHDQASIDRRGKHASSDHSLPHAHRTGNRGYERPTDKNETASTELVVVDH